MAPLVVRQIRLCGETRTLFRMGSIRFRRTFKAARGPRMNVSTLSESTSFGHRGASFSAVPRGGTGRPHAHSQPEQSHVGASGVLMMALVVAGLVIAVIALYV